MSDVNGHPKRVDRRGQWCIKDKAFDETFKDLVRRAAADANLGIGRWVAVTLGREARRQLGELPAAEQEGAVPSESLMEILARLDRIETRIERGGGLAEEGVAYEPAPEPPPPVDPAATLEQAAQALADVAAAMRQQPGTAAARHPPQLPAGAPHRPFPPSPPRRR